MTASMESGTDSNSKRSRRAPFFEELMHRTRAMRVETAHTHSYINMNECCRERYDDFFLREHESTLAQSIEASVAQTCGMLPNQLVQLPIMPMPIRNAGPVSADPSLYIALYQQDWDKVLYFLQYCPSLAKYQHPKRGLYPLHLACLRGCTPLNILVSLVDAYPAAVNLKTLDRFRDTPLHIVSRNSQRTSSKVKALLPHADSNIVNAMGHTALHTACGTNAVIDVLYALIDKDENLLDIKDTNGQTPVIALWESFMQSIPGHLTVNQILQGGTDCSTKSFCRFWEKVQLLVLRRQCQQSRSHDALGHAIVESTSQIPKMLHVALILDPQVALNIRHGNTLFHSLLQHHFPFHPQIFELMASQAASRRRDIIVSRNAQGKTILGLAIEENMVTYIPSILAAAPDLLGMRDVQSRLYPFQLAAACHECSTTLIYQLLREGPEVIQYD